MSNTVGGNAEGLRRRAIAVRFLTLLDYSMLTEFAPFLKNENGRTRPGDQLLQEHHEGVPDIQLQPGPHVRRAVGLWKEPDPHGPRVPVPR